MKTTRSRADERYLRRVLRRAGVPHQRNRLLLAWRRFCWAFWHPHESLPPHLRYPNDRRKA